MYHPTLTPRRVLRSAMLVAAATGPTAGLVLVGFWLQWPWVCTLRPLGIVMVYLLLLLLFVAALAVAVLASIHLAIHQAFRAGLDTGRATGESVPAERGRLQVVGGRDSVTR